MSSSPSILVTGANRGLGLEIARQLARRGARVIITARTTAVVDSTVAQLRSEGLASEGARLEATHPASIAQLAEALAQRGPLDVLINNAGINVDGTAAISDVSGDVLARTFATNTHAPLALAQALLPLIRKSRSGRILNMSSSMAATGNRMPGYPAYRMSKAALNSATIQLAAQLAGEGLAVNAICPGWVRTDLGGPQAPLSVEEGADTMVWAALDAPQSLTGKFLSQRTVIPW